jgi:type IV pilus assembly protein PilO
MATKQLPKFDLAAVRQSIQSQFRGLNPNDPSTWPIVPRAALFLGVIVAIVTALWFVWLNGSADTLQAEQAKEGVLRTDYQAKLTQAVNLDALKKQLIQVQQYVTQLEKQLPSKAEMDALLSDINQAGLGRSLNFELFRPGSVSIKEYYAELPITLRVTGRFHDVGAFAADIANLSRIVTLNNIAVTPNKDGTLVMDATAKTFRYLDGDEVAAQRKAAPKAAPKAGAKTK